MSDGAFRDASAAIERAAMLEQENEALRAELGEMAALRVQLEELEKLRAEVEELRALARSENEGAYVKRLGEERDELAREVSSLRARLGEQQGQLIKLRFVEARSKSLGATVAPLVERVVDLLKPK